MMMYEGNFVAQDDSVYYVKIRKKEYEFVFTGTEVDNINYENYELDITGYISAINGTLMMLYDGSSDIYLHKEDDKYYISLPFNELGVKKEFDVKLYILEDISKNYWFKIKQNENPNPESGGGGGESGGNITNITPNPINFTGNNEWIKLEVTGEDIADITFDINDNFKLITTDRNSGKVVSYVGAEELIVGNRHSVLQIDNSRNIQVTQASNTIIANTDSIAFTGTYGLKTNNYIKVTSEGVLTIKVSPSTYSTGIENDWNIFLESLTYPAGWVYPISPGIVDGILNLQVNNSGEGYALLKIINKTNPEIFVHIMIEK